MLRLIFAFVDIMLHRRGPDHLPSSQFLLWFVLAASLVVEIAVSLFSAGDMRIVTLAVLLMLLNLWFVWALLRAFGKEQRFRQTMTALLGVDTVLSLVSAPLVPLLAEPLDPENPVITLPMFLMQLVILWSIDINAFVFSRALERSYLLCLAIVFSYFVLMTTLQSAVLQVT